MPSFTSLAQEILAYAQRLDQYVVAEKLPSSSFDQDSISELPDHLETVRKDLINSTATLKQLAQGPVGAIAEKFLGVSREIKTRKALTGCDMVVD